MGSAIIGNTYILNFLIKIQYKLSIANSNRNVNEPLQVGKNFDTIAEKNMAGEKMNSDYIAVFDSGVGGISVLRRLLQVMPEERYIYYGDSANAPYGARHTEEVRQLVLAAAARLMERGIKALVVACNTATAVAIDVLRQTYPNTVIIGIEPALKVAVDHFPHGRIGVLATPVTLSGEKFRQLSHRFDGNCQISSILAPGLVELVESGKANSPESEDLLRPLLTPYIGKLDALVLGCTHYPFAAPTIAKILGSGTRLYDGGEGTARETKRRLAEADLLHSGKGKVIIENSLPTPAVIARSIGLIEENWEVSYG